MALNNRGRKQQINTKHLPHCTSYPSSLSASKYAEVRVASPYLDLSPSFFSPSGWKKETNHDWWGPMIFWSMNKCKIMLNYVKFSFSAVQDNAIVVNIMKINKLFHVQYKIQNRYRYMFLTLHVRLFIMSLHIDVDNMSYQQCKLYLILQFLGN